MALTDEDLENIRKIVRAALAEQHQAKTSEAVRTKTLERVRRHRKLKAGLPDAALDCAYCGETAYGSDHVVPRSKGGGNEASNIVPCCFRCNQHKGTQDVVAFIDERRYPWLDLKLIASHPHLKQFVETRNDSKRNTQSDGVTGRNATSNARNGRACIEFDSAAGAFKGISEEQELRWQEAYPAVPIPPAIAQAAAWLVANPANKKSNYSRFLVGWFTRAQDKAARVRR